MPIDIDLFPAAKLFEIDRLWTRYSQERFGFSIQQKIWLELGGKLNNFDSEIYVKWVKQRSIAELGFKIIGRRIINK